MTYICLCAEETERFASDFTRYVKAGDVIFLSGDLGAGKTVFTRGLSRGLGYTGRVTSPTFSLMNVYEGGRLTVFHFDLYRLGGAEDLENIGCEEYFDAGGICVVEWPGRVGFDSAREGIWVEIRGDLTRGENYREITVCENIGD